jgi:solute carrier family 10 (sodium/bile acid cotransporter), member 7
MQAQGNDALALLLTVGSNTLGVLTIPCIVRGLLRSVSQVNVNATALSVQLVVQILIPLAIGMMLVALIPALKKLVKENRKLMSLASNGSIVLIVWEVISRGQVRHRCAA